MGVGLSAIASVPVRAGKPLSRADAFAKLREAIDTRLTDPLDHKLLSFNEQEHTLYVLIHPLTEHLELVWEPAQNKGAPPRIIATTKTSTLGPGYHAWLVDLLKEIGPSCGLSWDWSEDESSFAVDGDFAALQRVMSDQLHAMAAAFLEHADGEMGADSGFAVNMSIGFGAVRPGEFTQTPLGPRDRAWWESIAAGHDLPARCREFYMWWDRERDAGYWYKLGLSLMWTEIPWRPPTDETEEALCRLALDALDRACTIDRSISLPAGEMNELAELLELDPEADELPQPRPDGIGYHRGPMNRRGPGGWGLVVPGYFFQEWDEGSGQLSFWHGNRSVFVSSYEIPLKDGKPVPAAELADSFGPDENEAATDTLEASDEQHLRRAIIAPYEEDGFVGQTLQGCVAAEGQCAIVTVVFADPDDRPWAEETWKSLKHQGPPEA